MRIRKVVLGSLGLLIFWPVYLLGYLLGYLIYESLNLITGLDLDPFK